ncbi:SDR family oxidoreductase [archaeon]|nr:SDR family oxidoreductase [archaeon]
MRCLVTGGAGFIGSWLCQRLLDDGYDVTCMDNFLSGSKKNLDDRVKIINADVSKPLKENIKTDYIFHLASLASPKFYKDMPVETMMANSFGTFNMLNLAKKNNARILYASSSEVYGDPKEHPQKETYYGNVNPVGERSCYDEGKRFGEALTFSFSKKTNLKYCIIRIFNTYGPRMRKDDGRVIPNFIMQALNNKDITIYGNGKQTRSFCYVADTVDGLCRAAFSDYNDVFNIGNPAEIDMIRLANTIKGITESKSKIVFSPIGMDDPEKRKPDITKSQKMLKWTPKTDLNTGLKTTVDWFKNS